VRFLREAVITARLEHPGIVAVHEAGRWPDGTPFYAMRLVSGQSLRELISERATVTARLGLLHHVLAVTDAIAYAHARHVIHRDLKPANVVVGDCGETIVVDWGLAKDLATLDEPERPGQARSPSGSELTAEGTVLGTPAYMAPEQARGEPVDQRADVFAIGVMLWELCTLTRIPPPQPRDRRRTLREAGIDDDLAIIVDKALATDPAQRYPDAGALAGDLKAFKSGARIASRRYSAMAMLGHWVRRHRAIAGSAIAASLAVAILTVVSIRNVVAARDRAEAANDARVLTHAELLLGADPTAAIKVLASYRGSDELRHRRLVAEAEGRGVARAVLTPHSDTIWFLVGDSTGAVVSDTARAAHQLARAGEAPRTAAGADLGSR
jgi:eukaryotic-like serine/threonine-protein kinase